MANEGVKSFGPESGWPLHYGYPTGGATQPYSLVPVGNVAANVANGVLAGAAFPPAVDSTMYYYLRVPNAATLATGLTFHFVVTDDPLNPPNATGLKTFWGITVAPVTSGTSTPDDTVFASSTEDTVQITMGTTIGVIITADKAAVVAHFNSLAAGGDAMIRLKRKGATTGSSGDTYTGRVVLLLFEPRNT